MGWHTTKKIEEIPLLTHKGRLRFAPSLQIYLYDSDLLSKDDPLARFSVSMPKIKNMNKSLEELSPTWFPLSTFEGVPIPDAKILATFQILKQEELAILGPQMPNIKPATDLKYLQIVTLGLRNMQSALGLNKLMTEFELPNGKRFGTTQSRVPSAKNPNFLQILKIPIDIPIQRIFSPVVDIEVRDTLFGGLIKRLIGTAVLDLSKFLDDDAEEKLEIPTDESVARARAESAERKKKEEEEKKEWRK